MSSTSYTYTYESTYDPVATSASTSPYREVGPSGLRQGPPPGGGNGESGQNGFYNVIDEGQLQTVERHSSQTERVRSCVCVCVRVCLFTGLGFEGECGHLRASSES